jgi:nitrate/nitrite transporter NarK
MPATPEPSVSQRVAIIAFALGALYFAYAFIQRVTPSIMTVELMRDFKVGGAALGSLSAFYFWTYAAIQLPVGMLTDRFGPRKLMSLALGVCAIAAFGFATSDSLFLASFWRAIIGGSVAFAFVGTLAIAGYWFHHSRHAMLVGVLQCVGMLGAIFAQAPLRPVVENIGWRNTMTILAGVAVVLALLLFRLIPRRSDDQRRTETSSNILTGLKSVATNPQSWLCALIGFGMASTMLSFSGLWAVPWLSTVHGYTTTEAAGIASTLFLGWALFSPLVGWISDRIGRRNILMQVGAAIYIALFALLVFRTPDSTAGLMALLFTAGAFGSSVTVCFIVSKEHNDPAYASTAVSLMNMFVVGSGAVMQPLIGWLLDRNWDGQIVEGARIYSADAYTTGFTSLLVVMTAALVGTFILRETWCKPAYHSDDELPS